MGDYDEYRSRNNYSQDYEGQMPYSQTIESSYETNDTVTSTLLFNDMPTSVMERDLKHALDDERARYLDIRFVRDKSRCFAFVDFASPDEAMRLVRNCRNQISIRNYGIAFDFADPKDEAYRYDRQAPTNDTRFSGNVEEPTSTVMVRGMPVGIDERDIMDELNRSGVRFLDVRVIRDRMTGVSRGFGFIEFASTQEATQWMNSQNGILNIRRNTLRLNFSSNRNDCNSRENRTNIPAHNPAIPNPEAFNAGDWICSRCSSHNFRRRDSCFRCQLTRSQSQVTMSNTNGSDGSEFIGTSPCNTLVLRCLDALTTEASILTAFEEYAQVQVKRCHVMRDCRTNASHCFAFAELPSVADAYKVVDTVVRENKLFEIDGKAVSANYAKNNFNTVMATLKADGVWHDAPIITHQMPSSVILPPPQPSTANLVFQQPLSMTPRYPMPQFSMPPPPLPASASSGAAVAAAAIQQKQTEARLASIVAQSVHHPQGILGYPPATTVSQQQPGLAPTIPSVATPARPFNADTAHITQYPFPDTTKFLYDESIRYYYDPVTGLYYEPRTRYFFDRTTQAYFHYDAQRAIYIPASEALAAGQSQQQSQQEGDEAAEDPAAAKKIDKKEKEKNAQKIAKEMEKWAKRMNSQKEPIAVASKLDSTSTESSKTADMAYAMLQAAGSSSVGASSEPATADSKGLVAQYGGEDSETEEAPPVDEKELEAQVAAEEERLMDWSKNACLICSRGFKDAETMKKHRALSNLHLQNLNKLRTKYGLKEVRAAPSVSQQQPVRIPAVAAPSQRSHADTIASLMQLGAAVANSHAKTVAANKQQFSGEGDSSPTLVTGGNRYRDRARERREKFGPSAPPPPAFRVPIEREVPPPPTSFAQPPPPIINGDVSGDASGANVGSRLMAKMGWQAGQGLGKANQGRIQLVEPEFREMGVGLGVKNSKRLPPSDNYKDNVKRAMYARYHEIE